MFLLLSILDSQTRKHECFCVLKCLPKGRLLAGSSLSFKNLPLGGANVLWKQWIICHWLLTQTEPQSPTAHDLSEPRERWLWHRLMTHVGYSSGCIKTEILHKFCIKESYRLKECTEWGTSYSLLCWRAFCWCSWQSEGLHVIVTMVWMKSLKIHE